MNKAIEIAGKVFGKKNFEIINPGYAYINQFKIVTFVPVERSDEVAFSIASAGGGVIGNYTVCSFRTKGVGTFKGGRDSKPVVGSPGKYEMAEEVRLEMICEPEYLNGAIDEMIKAHPYEEVAYEIYPVHTRNKKPFEHTACIRLNKKILYKNIIYKVKHSLKGKIFPGIFSNMFIDTLLINAGKHELNPNAFIDLNKPFLHISYTDKKITFDIIEQR